MGKPIAISFVYYVVISMAVAYVTGRTLAPGSLSVGPHGRPNQMAAWKNEPPYASIATVPAIWKTRRYSAVGDAIVYGLLTAGAFGWLWPR